MRTKNPIIELLGQGRPLIMGIVNNTPDSFSDGGAFANIDDAVCHALRLIDDGADILDIGGESTRPGAAEVSIEIEIERTIELIAKIRARSDIPISIDTRKPKVAELAMEAGANMWNDVSALSFAADSIEIAARLNVPIVLMHFQGLPHTMQDNPVYRDVMTEVLAFLTQRVATAINSGIARENLILDPGIGFGKTLEHNLELIANLQKFASLGLPVLFGASRKKFINLLDKSAEMPANRLGGSIAAALIAISKGAHIIRVHDVAETRQALLVHKAVSLHAL
jgi:dihydropteroate synthase